MEEEISELLERRNSACAESDIELLAVTTNKLAKFYHSKGRYEDALDAYEECRNLWTKMGKHVEAFRANNFMDDIYDILEKFAKAPKEVKEWINIASAEESNIYGSLQYYDRALDVAKHVKGSKHLICEILCRKASIYFSINNNKAAKQVLIEAFKIQQRTDSPENKLLVKNLRTAHILCQLERKVILMNEQEKTEMIQAYETMGNACFAVKNFNQAIVYYRKILKCSEGLQNSDKKILSALNHLTETCTKTGKIQEALKFNQKVLSTFEHRSIEACKTALSTINLVEVKKSILLRAKSMKLELKVLTRMLKIQEKYNFLEEARRTRRKIDVIKRNHCLEYSEKSSKWIDAKASKLIENISISDILEESEDIMDSEQKNTYKVHRNGKGETDLHKACISGNFKEVKRLLDEGHPLNVTDYGGWTPLHEVCNHGHSHLVDLLIRGGATVDDAGGDGTEGMTPLHDACVNGHLDVAQILLGRGACPWLRTNNNETPLSLLSEWAMKTDLSASQREKLENIKSIIKRILERVGMIEKGADLPETKKRTGDSSWADDSDEEIEGSMNEDHPVTIHKSQGAGAGKTYQRAHMKVAGEQFVPLHNESKAFWTNKVPQALNREANLSEKKDLVKQDGLVFSQDKGKPKLKNLHMRPSITARKMTGTLEAHVNGFRYTSDEGNEIDILYQNIRHAIYQPCDREMILLLHFHLKHGIVFGIKKEKHIDVQFYIRVGKISSDMIKHTQDDPAAQLSKRQLPEVLQNSFWTFCQEVQSMTNKEIEFDIPCKDSGFLGAPPSRSIVLLQTTSKCLIHLIEWPPFVITLQDVELVHFERVQMHLKGFDMTFVFKDYRCKVVTLKAVPMNTLNDVKELLGTYSIRCTESMWSWNWTKIMRMVTDDPKGFFSNGGWTFLDHEMESGSEQEEEDENYEPESEGEDSEDTEYSDSELSEDSESEEEESCSEDSSDSDEEDTTSDEEDFEMSRRFAMRTVRSYSIKHYKSNSSGTRKRPREYGESEDAHHQKKKPVMGKTRD